MSASVMPEEACEEAENEKRSSLYIFPNPATTAATVSPEHQAKQEQPASVDRDLPGSQRMYTDLDIS